MSFGINYIPNAPWGAGYDQLCEHLARIKPLRLRDKTSANPYGGRRQGLYIRKEEGTNDIIIRMYSTDVARFRSDETITANYGSWPSQSTAFVLSHILGSNVKTSGSGLYVRCYVEGMEGAEDHKGGYFPLLAGATFQHGDYRLEFVPTPDCPSIFPTTHQIDRKAANAARRELKEFKKFFTNIFMLCDGRFSDSTREEVLGSMTHDGPSKAYSWVMGEHTNVGEDRDIEADYMKAVLLLAGKWYLAQYRDSEPELRNTLKKRMHYLNHCALLANKESVFVPKLDRSGVIKKDPLQTSSRIARGY